MRLRAPNFKWTQQKSARLLLQVLLDLNVEEISQIMDLDKKHIYSKRQHLFKELGSVRTALHEVVQHDDLLENEDMSEKQPFSEYYKTAMNKHLSIKSCWSDLLPDLYHNFDCHHGLLFSDILRITESSNKGVRQDLQKIYPGKLEARSLLLGHMPTCIT